MTLPALLLTLAMAPVGSGDAAEPWRELEAECNRLADVVAASSRVSADGLAAAGDACRAASEAVPTLAGRAVLVLDASSYYRRAAEAGHGEAPCRSAAMLRTFATQLAAPGVEDRPNDRAAVAGRLAEIAGRCPAGDEPAGNKFSAATARPPTPKGPEPGPGDHKPKPVPVRRPLRIAGGAMLGVGLAFGGGMIAALVRGASLRDQAEALRDQHSGQTIGADDASTFATITRRGELADHAAIGLGVAAGALSVAGAALLVLDARRSKAARFALQPSILPTAGLRLAMEF